MKIYTKTGDNGETSLYGGQRISKDDIRIETIGTVDELNSVIGVIRSKQVDFDQVLQKIQNKLFVLGAELSSPDSDTLKIAQHDVEQLEQWIDSYSESLPQLREFILPGGSELAAQLHLARSVCRRAERNCVALMRFGLQVIWLNRLSDLLFVLARYSNYSVNIPDEPWRDK